MQWILTLILLVVLASYTDCCEQSLWSRMVPVALSGSPFTPSAIHMTDVNLYMEGEHGQVCNLLDGVPSLSGKGPG